MTVETTPVESAQHGRVTRDSFVVKRYLDSLESGGRQVNPDKISARLRKLDSKLRTEDSSLRRLDLMQSRIELEAKLADATSEDFEAEFVGIAAAFSKRKKIGYKAWRAMGVTPGVLQKAGILR